MEITQHELRKAYRLLKQERRSEGGKSFRKFKNAEVQQLVLAKAQELQTQNN